MAGYYSTLRKKTLRYTTPLGNREDLTLGELSKAQKDKHCMIPLPWLSAIIKLREQRWDGVCCEPKEEGNGRLLFSGLKYPVVSDRTFDSCVTALRLWLAELCCDFRNLLE